MSTLVVAHDAGGAEVLSSWAKREDSDDLYFWLDGPAVDIFQSKLGGELRSSEAWPSILGIDLVLCGTGSGPWEREAIRVARSSRIRCVAWLDHWVNYRERFDVLPDEIWVCDTYALERATELFPGVLVVLQGNPYLADALGAIRSLEVPEGSRTNSQERVLFVCSRGEPNPPEDLVVPAFPNFRVRPHPADSLPRRPLAEDIAWADVVVGYDSMAMVVALKAGRRVYSLLSPFERSIPYAEISKA